jgi:hypothetical protein
MSQITKIMPECIEELIFGSGCPDFPYFSSGTGFFAIYEGKPLFITAQHCLGKTKDEIEKNVSQLYLPIAPRDVPNRSTYESASAINYRRGQDRQLLDKPLPLLHQLCAEPLTVWLD